MRKLLILLFLFLTATAHSQQFIVVEKILNDEIIIEKISPTEFKIVHQLKNLQSDKIENLIVKGYLPLEANIMAESPGEENYQGERRKTVTFILPSLEPHQTKELSYSISLTKKGNYSLYLGHKKFSFQGHEQEILPQLKEIEVTKTTLQLNPYFLIFIIVIILLAYHLLKRK